MTQYLTTKEVAELLRIKERKVYDLASSGVLPCTKAIGKLLFPQDQINAWLANNTDTTTTAEYEKRPNVMLGSHDPLLDWAIRESRCGMAMLMDSSRDGLKRFAAGEGIAAGTHLPGSSNNEWNEHITASKFAAEPVVLMEWAWRQRGLVLAENVKQSVQSMHDIRQLRFVPRQVGAGSQVLFEQHLHAIGFNPCDLQLIAPVRGETDVVQSVASGAADAGFALECIAASYKLPFVPIISERFDLLVDRRSWFEPAFQTLLAFCQTELFRKKTTQLRGYDMSGFGSIHFNGA